MSSSLDIKNFISTVSPFDQAKSVILETFVEKFDIVYYKKDAIIAKEAEVADSFYIIAKGIITDGDDYFSEKDYFDLDALLSESYAATYTVVEEVLLYKVPKKDFLDFMHSNPEIERYFLRSSAKKLGERRFEIDTNMVRRIREIEYQKPIYVNSTNTIFETVEVMCDANSTFALVELNNGGVGIVTDSDLRKKVLLKRLSYDANITSITTNNVYSIDEDEFLFNAMLAMTKYNIKRLLVTSGGKVSGILQYTDILITFSTQTQFLARKIEIAKTNKELQEILAELRSTIERLLKEGIKARDICQLVGEINTQVFKKLFNMLADEEIKDNICLVVSGSEGRGEQILRTDQDNMIIIKDGFNSLKVTEFANKFHDALAEIGFPECPGKIMANNPEWTKSLKEFKSEIFEAINKPTNEGFLFLPILMDTKAIAGDASLCDELKNYLASHLNQRILSQLAKACLSFETPLSMFNAFILGKNEHDGELDIKKGGIFAIVNGVRVLSYEKGIIETNSFAKLKELANKDLLDKAFAEEIGEAYSFLLEIRLKERLYKIKVGKEPNNYIDPIRLSKLERDLLKDAFKIVDKFKKFIHAHFKLGYIA